MTELLLKKHKDMDIWQQNIWLSFWKVVVHFASLSIRGWGRVAQTISFRNFNMFAFILILTEAIKSLSTSYIQKKSNAIIESILTCFSLIVAAIFVTYLLKKEIPVSFFLSVSNIGIAIYVFNSTPLPAVTIDMDLPKDKVVPDSIEIESS